MLVSMTAFWVVIQELLDIVQPARLVEIGGDEGECTKKLCVWADAHQARVHVIETQPKETLIKVVGQHSIVKLHVGTSLEVLSALEKAACFFIDGDHNYYTVSNELKSIAQHHQPDLIFLHDVGWPWGRRDLYYDVTSIPAEERHDYVTDPTLGIMPGQEGVFRRKGLCSNGRFAFAKLEGGPKNGVLTAVQDFLAENPNYEFFTIDCVFGLGILVPKSLPQFSQVFAALNPYIANQVIALLENDRLQTWMNSLNKAQPALFSGLVMASDQPSLPLISVIIVVYNMQRAAPRTLQSFTSAYQGVSAEAYEVIVIENGSDQALSREQVEALGPNFRYFVLPNASPSPVGALNFGVKQSKGKMVALMIDGAHLVTPGVLKYALRALKAYANPVVSTLALQLGTQMQRLSIKNGYSENIEDDLLRNIGWPHNPYALFAIASLTGVNSSGWFLPMAESNCIFLLRDIYDEIGGFDERFDAPGGGLANLDFYQRVCEHPTTELIVLLGEGSFHQIHGGVSTNADEQTFQNKLAGWMEQYKTIRGKDFQPSNKLPECWGHLPTAAVPLLDHSASSLAKKIERNRLMRNRKKNPGSDKYCIRSDTCVYRRIVCVKEWRGWFIGLSSSNWRVPRRSGHFIYYL